MKQSHFNQFSIRNPEKSLARLSEPHGYRFTGDEVHLHARFTLLDPAAHLRQWALQLWACPTAPTSALDLAGHIVTEIALPPMAETADHDEDMDVEVFAMPPAGGGEHYIALVLASGQPGQFDEIHDVQVYPLLERFLQPRLGGNVGYAIKDRRVEVFADRIENPRCAGNLSGTLALELWALPGSYAGGSFQGHRLAGVVIGLVCGQGELPAVSCDLQFTAPPPGCWHFVLMLREWTANGYVTRDFTSFRNPVGYPAASAAPFMKSEILAMPATVEPSMDVFVDEPFRMSAPSRKSLKRVRRRSPSSGKKPPVAKRRSRKPPPL